jgi:hypothetical protein
MGPELRAPASQPVVTRYHTVMAVRVYISYAAADNKDGFVVQFAQGLEEELQVYTGEAPEVLLDFERMLPGGGWSHEVKDKVDRAQVFVPVLSPSYFRSGGCRLELDEFLKTRDPSLIFPVRLIRSKEPPSSPVVKDRKITDFRDLRFDLTTSAARRAIANLSQLIRDAYDKLPTEGEPQRHTFAQADPVYIKSLRLKDFKCFKEIELRFDRPSTIEGRWTCIAGINGAGKSSILQALSVALLGERATELGGGRLDRMRRHADVRNRYRAIIQVGLDSAGVNQPMDLKFEIDDGRVVMQEGTRGGQDGPTREKIANVVTVGYGATRNLSPKIDSSSEHLSRDVRRHITLFEPLSQIAGADVLLSRQPMDSSFVFLLLNAVQQVFGPDLQVTPTSPLASIFFSAAGGDYLEAEDLPDGFRSAVAWLADLCSYWCEVAPEIATGSNPADIQAIVLIDEIDLHLHPSLQRAIIPRLRRTFPKVQWIVTTHSPLVVANFDMNEIIALDRDHEGNVRQLDRQILNFTADEIYDWLMGTPPKGGEIEQEIRDFDEGNGKGSDELASRMLVSPQTDENEATQQVAEFKEILRSLKH